MKLTTGGAGLDGIAESFTMPSLIDFLSPNKMSQPKIYVHNATNISKTREHCTEY
jgi:hypothetical protein